MSARRPRGRETPLTYLAAILATAWRHGGELALAAGAIALSGIAALALRSQLQLQPFNSGDVVLLLLPVTIGALLFVLSMAAWRLHRGQAIALDSARTLLDLNEGDRTDLARQLHDRYRSREARAETAHAMSIDRLTGEIASLRKPRNQARTSRT